MLQMFYTLGKTSFLGTPRREMENGIGQNPLETLNSSLAGSGSWARLRAADERMLMSMACVDALRVIAMCAAEPDPSFAGDLCFFSPPLVPKPKRDLES